MLYTLEVIVLVHSILYEFFITWSFFLSLELSGEKNHILPNLNSDNEISICGVRKTSRSWAPKSTSACERIQRSISGHFRCSNNQNNYIFRYNHSNFVADARTPTINFESLYVTIRKLMLLWRMGRVHFANYLINNHRMTSFRRLRL